MHDIRAAVHVRLPPEEVYDLYLNATRFDQWQQGVIRAFDATGDVGVPGATYRLDYGPRLKRTVTVVAARRPEHYRFRVLGSGQADEAVATFEPAGDGTRLSLEWQVKVGLGPVGWLVGRFGRARMQRLAEEELARFAELAVRQSADARPGALYSVDCTAGYRVVQVLAAERDVVHLRLLPGNVKKRPTDARPFLQSDGPNPDPLTMRALDPRISNVTRLIQSGQRALSLDGAVGVPHVAVTADAFTDALPEPIGELGVPEGAVAEIAAWREADGPLTGRDIDFAIVPLVAIPGEEDYLVAKILRSDLRIIHVRMYSDRWPERPESVNPWTLRLDPHWSENPGVGHMPIARGSFSHWGATFLRLAMLGTAELEGYRYWKEAGGGLFA